MRTYTGKGNKWMIIAGIACLGILFSYLLIYFWVGQSVETGNAEKKVRLQLTYAYQNAQWNEAIEKTIEAFEEEYPDIDVVYQIHFENKTYENVLNKLIARDELGDIVQLKTPKPYEENGILGKIRDDVAAKVQSEYIYEKDGAAYGMGMVNGTGGIIYNRDVFEKVAMEEPKTYEEFLQCCKKLRKNGIVPLGVGGSDLWHMEFWVNHFFRTDILSKESDWLEKCAAGKTSWRDEEIGVMFSHLQELFSGEFVADDWRSVSDGQLPYKMAQGEIGMVYGGPWLCDEIKKLNPDMNLGWFFVPDAKGNIYVGENRDTFWAVTTECEADKEKYDGAMKFLAFFYSEENYARICSSITAFSTIEEDSEYEMTAFQNEVTEEYMKNTDHITGFIGNDRTPQSFEEEMLRIIQRMLSGELTRDKAQQRCQKLWITSMAEENGQR